MTSSWDLSPADGKIWTFKGREREIGRAGGSIPEGFSPGRIALPKYTGAPRNARLTAEGQVALVINLIVLPRNLEFIVRS